MQNNSALTTDQVGEIQQVSNPVQFLSTVTFAELPENAVLTAQTGATTIPVLNTTRVRFVNTGAVTVTNLTGGQNGQQVLILGDGFTTLANNANIQTSTGANKLLVNNRVYSFVLFSNKWYEASP